MILVLTSKKINRQVDRLKKNYKIQHGKIIYSDLNVPAEPFFSKKYMISGKPDYVIRDKDNYIPVELKTGGYKIPQKNHIFQLAAYCHLIEESYNVFVPYGILVLNNQDDYKLPFNPKMRFELENTIKKMRYLLRSDIVTRNHEDPHRCINCSMRKYCDIKIK